MSDFQPYIDSGLKLCRIPPGTKGPLDPKWQTQAIKAPQDGWSHGLLHELSGTCAVDIDDLAAACSLLDNNFGVDLEEILARPETVQIVSGSINHAKLIYRQPFPLPSKKIVADKHDIINFRCIGCQDVLPPSIHPSGFHYRWVGDWQNLPIMPPELMAVWAELLNPPATPSLIDPDDLNMETIKAALRHINPDCDRKTWIEVGMALHSADPNYMDLWDAWSMRSTTKYNPREIAGQWRSFQAKSDGITIHTLYHHARQGGWKPNLEIAKTLFKAGVKIDVSEYLLSGFVVPPLPMDALPKIVTDYAYEISERVGADPAVSVSAALVSLCAVADARSRLWLGDQFSVPPVLWCTTVGPSSSKKSPATFPVFEPLLRIEAEDRSRFEAAMLAWEAEEAKHVATKKVYLAQAANITNLPNTVLPAVHVLPPRPVSLRFVLSDATSQKVVRLLQERPEGMACFLDEGSGWLSRVTNARSGEDRGCWVSCYEAKPYHFDRVGTGSIFLENMALSMHMNVQPRVIRNYIDAMQSDGMAQRFAPFVITDESASRVSKEVPAWASLSGKWEHTLRLIYAAGKHDYQVCPEGRKILHEFEKRLEERKKKENMAQASDGFQSAIGKMMGLLGRIILVFHIAETPALQTVALDTIRNAERVVEEYFMFAIEQFHNQAETFEKWVFDWVITGNEEYITEGDVRRASRAQNLNKSMYEQKEAVAMACGFLEKLGVLISIDVGNSRSVQYAVNPDVREKYKLRRIEVARYKQAKLDRSKAIVESRGKTTERRFARGYDGE